MDTIATPPAEAVVLQEEPPWQPTQVTLVPSGRFVIVALIAFAEVSRIPYAFPAPQNTSSGASHTERGVLHTSRMIPGVPDPPPPFGEVSAC